MEKLEDKLVEKSIEAFIVGLELYNKPTIKYRIEGFSFFIVNAWELMLKATLIKRGESIYFPDKPDRTLSVENVLRKVYTDKNTRIRLNLEKIIELRNISTHYITEDYEVKYAPLFQACVLNFVNEMQRFHNVDITKYIAQNFLTISARYEPLSNEELKVKYSPEIAEKLIKQSNEIDVLSATYDSDKFAINIRQNLYITKKKSEADFVVGIDSHSDTRVSVVKDLKDPSDTHKYSYKNVITAVQEKLKKKNIKLGYKSGFTQYVLNLIIDFYDIKQNPKYAYEHVIGNQRSYTYSQQFVDFIVVEIEKSPHNFVESLKKSK
jgi:HEPN domain-containing protein